MKEIFEDAIKNLIAKSVNAEKADEAMKFSQAAHNLANAQATWSIHVT